MGQGGQAWLARGRLMSYSLYDAEIMMSTKINARLDEELARQVARVQLRTRKGMTQIVKESLARYCATELAEDRPPLDALRNAGFVGVAQGSADLSSRYKSELGTSLHQKTQGRRSLARNRKK